MVEVALATHVFGAGGVVPEVGRPDHRVPEDRVLKVRSDVEVSPNRRDHNAETAVRSVCFGNAEGVRSGEQKVDRRRVTLRNLEDGTGFGDELEADHVAGVAAVVLVPVEGFARFEQHLITGIDGDLCRTLDHLQDELEVGAVVDVFRGVFGGVRDIRDIGQRRTNFAVRRDGEGIVVLVSLEVFRAGSGEHGEGEQNEKGADDVVHSVWCVLPRSAVLERRRIHEAPPRLWNILGLSMPSRHRYAIRVIVYLGLPGISTQEKLTDQATLKVVLIRVVNDRFD